MRLAPRSSCWQRLFTSRAAVDTNLDEVLSLLHRRRALAVASEAQASTLIVYVFRNTDPESINNLFFFLANGVKEDDGARYPSLPKNCTD